MDDACWWRNRDDFCQGEGTREMDPFVEVFCIFQNAENDSSNGKSERYET